MSEGLGRKRRGRRRLENGPPSTRVRVNRSHEASSTDHASSARTSMILDLENLFRDIEQLSGDEIRQVLSTFPSFAGGLPRELESMLLAIPTPSRGATSTSSHGVTNSELGGLTEQQIAKLPISRYSRPAPSLQRKPSQEGNPTSSPILLSPSVSSAQSVSIATASAQAAVQPTTAETKSPPTSATSTADCAFCLASFDEGDIIRTLPCFHFYHSDEIDDWLRRRAICPLCNAVVTTSD